MFLKKVIEGHWLVGVGEYQDLTKAIRLNEIRFTKITLKIQKVKVSKFVT